MESYNIKHNVMMPYYLQANGQVKGTNKIIEIVITNINPFHLNY